MPGPKTFLSWSDLVGRRRRRYWRSGRVWEPAAHEPSTGWRPSRRTAFAIYWFWSTGVCGRYAGLHRALPSTGLMKAPLIGDT